MINRALKAIRQFHGMTQSELASKLNMSKSYLSEIETAKKTVSYDLLQNYSIVFDVPVSSLVFFSESIDNNSISEKFRLSVTDKILRIMEWMVDKEDVKRKKIKN